MKLSHFAKYLVGLIGLALSAYFASQWLHANTLINNYLSVSQLFGILISIAVVVLLAIKLWPTWYRRLATLIVVTILGAEAVRWLGLAYIALGEEPPTWILAWFGPPSGITAAAAFLCVAVLACLDYMVKHGHMGGGFGYSRPDQASQLRGPQGEAVLPPLSDTEARARTLYLRELREDVEARLAASIHHARFIDLGLEDNPAATMLLHRYKNAEQQEFTDIDHAFQTYHQRMLILGAPGSGKTTTLLHIIKQLIQAAENDPGAPIPLIVNLSKFDLRSSRTWFRLFGDKAESTETDQDRSGDFERWLEQEFDRFPGVKREFARRWLDEGRVALMLDGLDEVDDEYRLALVDILNQCRIFRMGMPLVLCSRIHEYNAIQSRGSRLHLPGAVTLQPLIREQIDDYLDAAQASPLKQALPDDAALYEMAQTPLTLSMMTLAYGGMPPDSIPKNLSLTDRRHHLMEAYVSRMLQRKERRDRGIPFDQAPENDVPVADYRYAPDRINRYLSWLAISLSIRMQTAFSMDQFFPFMTRDLGRDQRSTVHWSTSAALASLIAVGTLIVGSTVVPRSLQDVGFLSLLAGLTGLIFVFADQGAAVTSREAKPWVKLTGETIIGVAVVVIMVVGSALVSQTATAIIPLGWSPIAMGQLTICLGMAVVVLTVSIADNDFDDPILWFLGLTVAAPVIAFLFVHLMPLDSRNGFVISGALLAAQIITTTAILFSDRHTPPGSWIAVLVALIVITALHAVIVWLVGEPNWYQCVGVVAAIVVFFLGERRTALPLVILFVLFAAMAGLIASKSGIVIASILFWYSALVFYLSLRGRFERSAEQLQDVAARWWLSPMLRQILVLVRALPPRWGRFFDYASGALILKRSAGDIEFVHRMLRDHFALRELIPAIRDVDDFDQRLDLIQNMGFQGESALDPLREYADHADPDIRVSAIKALARISHPGAVRCVQAAMNDNEPSVRRIAVQMCQFLPKEEASSILEIAANDQDASVQTAIPASAAMVYDERSDARELTGLISELLERTRVRDVLAEILAHYEHVDRLADKMPEWGWHSLRSLLRHANAQVRAGSLGFIRIRPEHADIDLVVRACEDKSPRVRAQAVGTINQVDRERASGILQHALSDRDKVVRIAAAEAILSGRAVESQIMRGKDPKERIRNRDVKEAVTRLGPTYSTSESEIRRKYEALTDELGLKLQWRSSWFRLFS